MSSHALETSESKGMVGRIFLGRYETVRLLGEGGMGRVYLARDTQLPRQVVVKVMHDHIASDPKFCDRFKRETDMTARFQHPYAVTLHDASLHDPQGPCIIMEYIKGITLDQLLMRNGRLNPGRVGRLLGQLCEVLQAAHGEGMVHRDLKPSNLMVVDPDSPYEKIKVMDFGLAKMLDQPSLNKITESNMDFAVGTPGYICPEQVRGEQADHRGDLYSVGIILYEMLSGRLPYAGRSTMDVLLAHATEPPPSFSDLGGTGWVPPAIEAVVVACLAKDPKDRPQTARDLAERYETALAHEEKVVEEKLPANHPRAQMRDTPTSAVVQSANTPKTSAAAIVDPTAVIHHLDAWMPEKIAIYKLRGFVNDVGGEVVESVPGRIRVSLGGRSSVYMQSSALSWLGLTKGPTIDLELILEQTDAARASQLYITVILRVHGRNANDDPVWRARCDQVYIDLRAYLIGTPSV